MNAIKNFVKKWKGRGYEKGDTQKFWLQFLRDVLNVSTPEDFIEFEKQVKLKNTTKFIDAYLQDSKVIIEQKSFNKNLDAEFLQSDGAALCEIIVDPKQNFEPKLSSKRLPDGSIVSPPIDDMFPFLPREEYAQNKNISAITED